MSQTEEKVLNLHGKRVVVLGGTSGIGFAIAQLACTQQATVVVGSRSEDKVATALERLSRATGQTVDLRDESSLSQFFESVGAFDHLAITAGDWDTPLFGSLLNLDFSQAQALMEVRFWGVLQAVKYASKIIAQDGSITLTGGLLAQRPRKGTVMATTLAGAVASLTTALAMDLAPIRVNAVAPGIILTEATNQRPEATLQALVAHQPLPRVGTPFDAAQAYLYLMNNSYVTGQVLPLDGGSLLV